MARFGAALSLLLACAAVLLSGPTVVVQAAVGASCVGGEQKAYLDQPKSTTPSLGTCEKEADCEAKGLTSTSSSNGATGCESDPADVKCCSNVKCQDNAPDGSMEGLCLSQAACKANGQVQTPSSKGATGCKHLPNGVACCSDATDPALGEGCKKVCHKDGCKPTWTNPIPKGETWTSKGVISDKGCCAFSGDACEECCPPPAAGTSSSGSSSGSDSELETLKADSETECSRFGDACELKPVDGKGSCCVPKCDNPSHLQETEEREPGVPQGCVQMVCLSQPDNTCLFPDVEKRNQQMAPEQFPGIVSEPDTGGKSAGGKSAGGKVTGAEESSPETEDAPQPKCPGPCIPNGDCASSLEIHSAATGNCKKITCEDCTAFVNSLLDKVDELFPHYKDATDSKNKDTIEQHLAPPICAAKWVSRMAFGYDKCNYFLDEKISDVVAGIQKDQMAVDICKSLQKGNNDFFSACQSYNADDTGEVFGGTSQK